MTVKNPRDATPNKIGRANGDKPFTFVVFIGRERRLIPSLT